MGFLDKLLGKRTVSAPRTSPRARPPTGPVRATAAKTVSSRDVQVARPPRTSAALKCFERNGEPFVVHTEGEIVDIKLFFSTIGENGETVPKDKRIEISSWLSNKVYPVLVAGRQNTLWLLATLEYSTSEDLLEIAKTAAQKGYQMHPDFQVIVC